MSDQRRPNAVRLLWFKMGTSSPLMPQPAASICWWPMMCSRRGGRHGSRARMIINRVRSGAFPKLSARRGLVLSRIPVPAPKRTALPISDARFKAASGPLDVAVSAAEPSLPLGRLPTRSVHHASRAALHLGYRPGRDRHKAARVNKHPAPKVWEQETLYGPS